MSLADRPRPALLLLRSILKGHLFAFVWLPRDEILSRLYFGRASPSLSAYEAVQLAQLDLHFSITGQPTLSGTNYDANRVYILPKKLDEEVARLHLDHLHGDGAVPAVLAETRLAAGALQHLHPLLQAKTILRDHQGPAVLQHTQRERHPRKPMTDDSRPDFDDRFRQRRLAGSHAQHLAIACDPSRSHADGEAALLVQDHATAILQRDELAHREALGTRLVGRPGIQIADGTEAHDATGLDARESGGTPGIRVRRPPAPHIAHVTAPVRSLRAPRRRRRSRRGGVA